MNAQKATLAFAFAMLISPLSLWQASQANAGDVLSQTGCGCFVCPSCSHCCELEAKMEDVEKSCFEVECKTICIPRVVFPWQKKKSCSSCTACDGEGCSSCVNNGARVRKIHVLKTKKYECPECKYKWTPKETSPCGDGCCDPGACDTGCCDQGCSESLGIPYGVLEEPAAPTLNQPITQAAATLSPAGGKRSIFLEPVNLAAIMVEELQETGVDRK